MILRYSQEKDEERVKSGSNLNLFPFSPSWGEINYFAFGVVSEEFHNELFGYLHNKIGSLNKHYDNGNKTVAMNNITSFDSWLDEQPNVIKTDSKHQNIFRGKTDKTMPAYIRNYIDHPGDDIDNTGNNIREKPTLEEIRDSIDFMVDLNKSILSE